MRILERTMYFHTNIFYYVNFTATEFQSTIVASPKHSSQCTLNGAESLSRLTLKATLRSLSTSSSSLSLYGSALRYIL